MNIIPNLDLIAAEYTDFDILSFTESWLKDTNTADSIELFNYQIPFRKDRVGHKNGEVLLFMSKTTYML